METTPSVTETEQITSSLTEATSQPTENATTVLETSSSMTVTTVTDSTMETTPSVTETEQITSSLTEATSQPTENATTVLETSSSMTVTTLSIAVVTVIEDDVSRTVVAFSVG